MWPLFTLCSLAVASGYFLMVQQVKEAAATPPPAGRFLAASMGTYRATVIDYVRQHPGAVVDASVNDDALQFPRWYTRHAQLGNHVIGSRTVVVYADVPDAAILAEALATLSQGSILAGMALPPAPGSSALTLHSPTGGDTGIAMPAVVPPGSAVWLATLE
jgi:hypothetical protein